MNLGFHDCKDSLEYVICYGRAIAGEKLGELKIHFQWRERVINYIWSQFFGNCDILSFFINP